MRNQEVTVDYRWGDTLVVIKGVPAGVCQQCGEKYIESQMPPRIHNLVSSDLSPLPFRPEDFTPENPFVKEIMEKGVRVV